MRPVLAALTLALLAFPATAGAGHSVTSGALAGGPRIVDGGLAWAEATRAGWRLRAERDGETFTAASSALPPGDDRTDEDDDDISGGALGGIAAAGRVATVELRESGGNTKARQYQTTSDVQRVALDAGEGAGATPLASCSRVTDAFGGGEDPVVAAVATDGRAIAVDQCEATKVFDASTGAQLAELPAVYPERQARPPLMALAGRYLASVVRSEIVVRDWQAGSEVYRVLLSSAPTGPGAFDFDLQDDGALAVVHFESLAPKCGGGALTWHTPAAPAGVPLPGVACAAEIAVDGGRAATVAEAPGGQVVAEVAPDGSRRDLAWLGTGRARRGSVDYQAGTAAYALEHCPGGEQLRLSAGDATPEPVACPNLRFGDVRLRGRRLEVLGALRVRGAPRVTVTYRAAGRTWRKRVRASKREFSARFRLPARARKRPGRLTATFAGDATYKPDTARRRVRPRR